MNNSTKQAEAQRTYDSNKDIAQAAKFGLSMATVMAGLIGAWGVTCLLSAVMNAGLGGVVKGFLSAISGI